MTDPLRKARDVRITDDFGDMAYADLRKMHAVWPAVLAALDRSGSAERLDVERLARAQHGSYERDPAMRRIEWADLSDAEKGMWRRHAKVVALEYAATPTASPTGCVFCNTPERQGPCFGDDRCMAASPTATGERDR